MKRSALRDFLQQLVLAALPLAALAGCDDGGTGAGMICAGFDAGSGTKVARAPISDGGLAQCEEICRSLAPPSVNNPELRLSCHDLSVDGGVQTVECDYIAMCGRRPAGLRKVGGAGAPSALGEYFARAAHLEAASVHAFARLAQELERHGFDRALILAARRAAEDEVVHARRMARVARGLGAAVPRVRIRRESPRSLLALALENAIEGCVSETFGALLALWQARAAGSRELRSLFTDIAGDETRHAELAWSIARAAEPRLSARARSRVARARKQAAAKLAQKYRRPMPASLVEVAGLPPPSVSAHLLARLDATIW